MVKISVLLPVYNGEIYLRDAIDSILCQTFKDFELVIIDDGSDDNTPKILADYLLKDSRIRVFTNEINVGIEKSLNKGFFLTQGEYFARQDSDDISDCNRLMKQLCYLESHSEIGAIGTAVELIDSLGNKLGESRPPVDHESLELLFLFNNFMHHSTLMARRELIQKVGGYDETKVRAEDYDLWWRLSRQSRLANLPELLLKRRIDDGPRVSVLYREKQLECSYHIALRAVKESLGNDFTIPEKSYQRLWWAVLQILDCNSYQKYWLIRQGREGQLTYKDICALKPLWDLIENHQGRFITADLLLKKLAFRLFHQGKVLECIRLLYLVWFRFNAANKLSFLFRN